MSVRLVGESSAHHEVLGQIEKAAKTDVEVVLLGPSGVGKELYARLLHERSARGTRAFVPVNCGAVPVSLFENELFGHVGGAFTGARPSSDGLVAEAEGGTLFLDEIDALDLSSQVKLLRFLQQREYRRLGDTTLRRSNVRVAVACNADLLRLVRDGRFREDLFFRVHVFPVKVPPLRERIQDLAPLLAEFVARFAEQFDVPPIRFAPEALRRLETYGWPGNVRELENCVRYLTSLGLERPVETKDLKLIDELARPGEVTPEPQHPASQPMQTAKRTVVKGFERAYLIDALRSSEGNIARAAEASGKPRRAFFELMRKHDIRGVDYRNGVQSVAARGRALGDAPFDEPSEPQEKEIS